MTENNAQDPKIDLSIDDEGFTEADLARDEARGNQWGAIAELAKGSGSQVAGGAGVLYILTRLIAVSGRSAPTALSFLDAQGISKTVTGAIVQALPFLLLTAATAATVFLLGSPLTGRISRSPRVWFSVAAWFLVVAAVPSPIASNAVVAVVAYVSSFLTIGYSALLAWMGWPKSWSSPVKALIISLAFVAGVQLLFDNQLWLAPERLAVSTSLATTDATADATIKDQPSNLVGYVLTADNNWTSVLLEQPRIVVRLPNNSIVQRSVCRLGEGDRERPPLLVTLIKKLFGENGRRVEDAVPLC